MDIEIECNECNDGYIGEANAQVCPKCEGDHKYFWGELLLPAGVFWSHLIYEAIDHDEYVALSSPNEHTCNAITACGLVDLNDGSRAKTVLWDLFDAQSTTRANLVSLIGG